MPNNSITVGELKEILSNYNDYEPVRLDLQVMKLSAVARLLVGEYENEFLELEE